MSIATSKTSVLKLDDIGFSYQGIPVLRHVSLDVSRGETVALMGPSGSGKSTLIRMISGLFSPDSGTVRRSLDRRGSVAVMFQNPLLQPWLTVEENVSMPLRLTGRVINVKELIDAVGLSGFENRYPSQLSGGEQRRVALARALAQAPDIICLDEPFNGLDELAREELLVLVSRIVTEGSLTCLLVSHSPLESVFLSDRIVILDKTPTTIVDEILVPLNKPRKLNNFDEVSFHSIVTQVRHRLRSGDTK